jgi:DNA-binding LacI/PurR family transcriptional regulator
MTTMDAPREPTLRDVARLAGVHPSTASRCMDAVQSARIGAATRERVLAAARELGYQLNPAASSLRSRRTMTIGVLIPDFRNPIYGSLLTGINDRLEDSGYTAVIVETKDDEPRMARALQVMRERRVDAVINTAAREQDRRPLTRFLGHGIPMVLASRDLPALDVPKILSDDFGGATLAAEHLLALGHRRIVQLGGPPGIAAFAQRARGFQYALGEADVGASALEKRAESPTVDDGARLMLDALREDGSLTRRVRPQRPAGDGRDRGRQAGRAVLPRRRLRGRVRRDPADRVPRPGADHRALSHRADGPVGGRNRAVGPARRRTAVGRGAAAPADHPGLHRPRA